MMETGMAMWGGQPRWRRWVSMVGGGVRGWGSVVVEGGEGREVLFWGWGWGWGWVWVWGWLVCEGLGGGCGWYLWSSMSCISATSSVIVSSNFTSVNFCRSTRRIAMLSVSTRCTCA